MRQNADPRPQDFKVGDEEGFRRNPKLVDMAFYNQNNEKYQKQLEVFIQKNGPYILGSFLVDQKVIENIERDVVLK